MSNFRELYSFFENYFSTLDNRVASIIAYIVVIFLSLQEYSSIY
jgi:hypothetical protein